MHAIPPTVEQEMWVMKISEAVNGHGGVRYYAVLCCSCFWIRPRLQKLYQIAYFKLLHHTNRPPTLFMLLAKCFYHVLATYLEYLVTSTVQFSIYSIHYKSLSIGLKTWQLTCAT